MLKLNWNIAEFEISFGKASQLMPSDMPEIVFSGRSNVGKSSLINTLLGRKSLARVSATPGKTATINFYRIGEVRLVDLPGYGYAKVSNAEKKRWAKLIEGYFDQDRDLRLVIQLVDSRHPPTKDDMTMIEYLTEREIPFVIALTKMDKLNKTQRETRLGEIEADLKEYEGVKLCPFSSVTREGMDAVRELVEYVSENESDEDDD